MFRVALFGHSFVVRMQRFRSDHPECMNRLPEDCSLETKGHSGLIFSRIFADPSKYLTSLKGYDVILVDLGTNDLCDKHLTPSMMVERSMELVHLFTEYDVRPKCVIFLSVLQRTGTLRQGQVPLNTFNHRARKYNAQLTERVKDMFPKVHTRSQAKCNHPKYNLDGCHLTDEGLQVYVSNIVHIVVRLKKSFDQGKI